MQFSAADLKDHLSIEHDDYGHDTLIEGYIAAAEEFLATHTRRDLDADFGAKWPEPLRQAIRLLVAEAYANREVAVTGTIYVETPMLKSIVAPYRNLAG